MQLKWNVRRNTKSAPEGSEALHCFMSFRLALDFVTLPRKYRTPEFVDYCQVDSESIDLEWGKIEISFLLIHQLRNQFPVTGPNDMPGIAWPAAMKRLSNASERLIIGVHPACMDASRARSQSQAMGQQMDFLITAFPAHVLLKG